MGNNIQLGFTEWLNKDNGYAVIQEFDMYGNPMEYVLVRGMFEEDGDSFTCENMEEIYKSKHIARIYSRFEKEMKDKKNYISDVRETLLNLTIEQLESLKPSYYSIPINNRISELERESKANVGDFIITGDGKFLNKNGVELKPQIVRGYYHVTVRINDEKSTIRIHREVAKAFIPNPDNLPEVNHKDGNKLNNRISNLEWCTRSYNVQHAYDNGLKVATPSYGENHGRHKLTQQQVNEIRDKYIPRKYTAAKLAKEYGVSISLISSIIRNEIWN